MWFLRRFTTKDTRNMEKSCNNIEVTKFQKLRLEVKVESGLEAVQLELAGREEPRGGGGSGGLEGNGEPGGLLGSDNTSGGDGIGDGSRTAGSRLGAGKVTSEVTGQETSGGALLVGGVEGVNEGVQAFASSAGRDIISTKDTGDLGGELGGVLVVAEVEMGGIVGVHEGVELLDGLGTRSGPGLGSRSDTDGGLLRTGSGPLGLGSGTDGSGGGGRGGKGFFDDVSTEEGGILTTGGDVSALEDPETFLAGGVLDGVGLAVFADVRVLADAVALVVGLFAEEDLVLGGEGGTGASVAGVEALLLQDLSVPLVDELGHGASGSNRAADDKQTKHV